MKSQESALWYHTSK